MELDELKSTWQAVEKALERGNQLSLAMLRRQKMDAVQKDLRPIKLIQAFQAFVGLLFVGLAALLWSTRPTEVSVILAGIAVQAYGIGCVITAVMVFSLLGRIDYAASVVEVQGGLALVRRAYGIGVVVTGLSWWVLWIPLLVLLAALAHVNLYAHAPSFVWIGVGAGVVGLLGTYAMYLWSLKSSNERFRQLVEHATFGRSLQQALQQLTEVRAFEGESIS